MKKTVQILNKYFYEIIFIFLVAIALFNGFCNIGIWQDGTYFIFKTIEQHIYRHIDNTRLFASIALHIPAFFISLVNLSNVEYLKFISILYGFWFYFITIIPLLFTYYLLPKNKKDWFVFPLISYLLSMIFTSYYIISEVHITIYLFWPIFMAFLFLDFKTVSLRKQILMLICCLLLIRTYQVSFFFALILLIIGLKQFYGSKKQMTLMSKIMVSICFVALVCAVIVNLYYLINPGHTSACKFFDNLYTIRVEYFIYYFVAAVALSLVKYKNKYIKIIQIFILIIVSMKFIVNNIEIVRCVHDFRHFVIIFSLIFSILLLYSLKRKIDFTMWKIVCAVLLSVYLINTIIFTSKINSCFRELVNSIQKHNNNIVSLNSFLETFPYAYLVTNKDAFILQPILVQNLYSNNRVIEKILVNTNSEKDQYFHTMKYNVILMLKNFGIYYSDDLIKEIDSLRQEQKIER